MASVRLRAATPADAGAIASLYAHHVLHGTASFEEVPPAESEIAARLARILDAGWPWLIAEEDGGAVLGYAYFGQLNPRSGYRYACENSVYVAHDAAGQGVGGILLDGLIDAARARGFREMVAIIGDSANAASIGLHASRGFGHVGLLARVGFKFGRALDVVHMQRSLEETE